MMQDLLRIFELSRFRFMPIGVESIISEHNVPLEFRSPQEASKDELSPLNSMTSIMLTPDVSDKADLST